MFDQAVTIQSLRNIILMENRKGNYLVSRFMPGVTRFDRRIDTFISYKKKSLAVATSMLMHRLSRKLAN